MIKQKLAASAAFLAVMQPQVAMAKACVEPADLSDAAIYLMPVAYDAFTSKCTDSLSDDGFIAREGDAFIAKYAALHDKTWEGTFSFFKTFMDQKSKSDTGMSDMFSQMPKETSQPFFDAMIKLMLAQEIKMKDCGKIEQILEPLAPLPPENFGMLVSRVFAMIPDLDEPKICPAQAK